MMDDKTGLINRNRESLGLRFHFGNFRRSNPWDIM